MNLKVYEINDAVRLVHICTDKFKKARLTVTFTVNADKEDSPKTSMLMPVAFLGTEKYADFREICCRAEELYAADISDFNIMRGGYQITGLAASILNDEYISSDDRERGFSILDGCFELLSEILKKPLFRESDTETEKINRINRIKARQNDAFGYAKYRFLKAMLENEPGGFTLSGETEQVEKYDAEILKKHHKHILENAPLEIFYCGTSSAERVLELIRKYFSGIGGSKLVCSDESKKKAEITKNITEEGEYRQGNLFVGFRTGVVLSDKDYYATELMNQIYGDGSQSKLFLNAREKKSLCYFCASSYDEVKGIIVVGCGIDNGDFEEAKNEILYQLEEMKRGNITDDELNFAKETIESDCRAAKDHSTDYEEFERMRHLFGGPSTIEEYRQGIMSVSREDIIAAAKKMTLDTVYFLKGTLGGEADDE